jgi:hypothetical protein
MMQSKSRYEALVPGSASPTNPIRYQLRGNIVRDGNSDALMIINDGGVHATMVVRDNTVLNL